MADDALQVGERLDRIEAALSALDARLGMLERASAAWSAGAGQASPATAVGVDSPPGASAVPPAAFESGFVLPLLGRTPSSCSAGPSCCGRSPTPAACRTVPASFSVCSTPARSSAPGPGRGARSAAERGLPRTGGQRHRAAGHLGSDHALRLRHAADGDGPRRRLRRNRARGRVVVAASRASPGSPPSAAC